MSEVEATSIIRERGQLTIPHSMRQTLNWLRTSSAVRFKVRKPTELVIVPNIETKRNIDWNSLWDSIQLARSFRGKKGSLAKFITIDRESH